MGPRRFAALATLSGTVALAGWGAAGHRGFGSFAIDSAVVAPAAMSVGQASTADRDPSETAAVVVGGVSAAEVPVVKASLPDPHPARPRETRAWPVTLFTPDPVTEEPKPAARPVAPPEECLEAEACIDDYLWSLYERTPKVDTNKVQERIKVTVEKKGKKRTITKTITKYVVGDFTWKDPIAAQRAGMSLKDYVIGGMDRGFKRKLYRALRAMDEAGHMPGITSAFRDDYRQGIASGNKAAADSSFHGGSRRGGYGRGLAADLVSVKGETRLQRYASSQELWKWIDAHEKELGIGRPYLDRDPPHVGPIDGKEYVAKRAQAKVRKARLETNKRSLAGATNGAKPAKSSDASGLQRRASAQR
jgi:hypothetical protein